MHTPFYKNIVFLAQAEYSSFFAHLGGKYFCEYS